MTRRRCQVLLFLAVSVGSLISGYGRAEELHAEWRTDCVGRMQIGLPGDVEVAALSADAFRDYVAGRGAAYPGAQFPDGRRAFTSTLSFIGSIVVSHPVDDAERKRFFQAAEQTKADDARTLKQQHGVSVYGYPATVEPLPVAKQKALAWRIGPSYSAYIEMGRNGLSWGVNSTPDQLPGLDRYYHTLIEGVSPRPLYTVPSESGVCLPYTFIHDDGTNGRYVNSTYRLREHPDITIWLEDRSARRVRKGQDPDLYSATERTDYFWMQNYSRARLTVRSLWRDLYKKVSLPAGNGVESFVALKRKDGTEDFGYLLAIRGDPDSKEDKPDLLMYVIRDAANAKSKGIEPVNQETVLEIGRAVAASIHHRAEGVETPSK